MAVMTQHLEAQGRPTQTLEMSVGEGLLLQPSFYPSPSKGGPLGGGSFQLTPCQLFLFIDTPTRELKQPKQPSRHL